MPHSLDYSLSEELIDRILSLTEDQSLASVCLANKTLNRIATPHLYRNVFLRSEGVDMGVKHILPFTFLMWSSPTHASMVFSFCVRNAFSDDAPPKNKDTGPGPNKLPWPEDAALEMILRGKATEHRDSQEEQEELFKALKAGEDENTILPLLLASLLNLQKVDLDFPMVFKKEKSFLRVFDRIRDRQKPFDTVPSDGELDTPPLENPAPFASLTDFMVTGDDSKYPNGVQFFGAAFNLPNLRRLYGWKQGETEADDADINFKKLRPRSCPVEYIEARTSKFHPKELKLMLETAIPGRLKIFNYEIGCTWAWVDVSRVEINNALTPHFDTLEALGLSHEDFYPYQFGNEADKADPLTFTHFTALRKLKLAPVYIWGQDGMHDPTVLPSGVRDQVSALWRALPSNLEQLWITRAERVETAAEGFVPDTLIPAFKQVAQYKKEKFSGLREIRIEFPVPEWDNEWFKNLARAVPIIESYDIKVTLILEGLGALNWDEMPERGWGWDEEVEFQECWANNVYPKKWIDPNDIHDLATYLIELKEEDAKAKQALKDAK